MPRLADNIAAYRIISLLVEPFKSSNAFKLGLIDAHGTPLRKPSTSADHEAYTYLHRIVYRIKSLLERTGARDFASYATALALVREHLEENDEDVFEEEWYLAQPTETDIQLVENFTKYQGTGFRPFRVFVAEEGDGGLGGVAANNSAATPGIAKYDPLLGKRKPKVIRRKALSEAELEGELKRSEMPQLTDFEAFKTDLEQAGHTLLARRRAPRELTPMQKHFNQEKVDKLIAEGSWKLKDIIVAQDDKIVDGHHRWKAAEQVGEDIGTKQTSLTFDELLDFVEGKSYVEHKNLKEHST